MKEVILVTSDGWRKRVGVEDDMHKGRFLMMALRDYKDPLAVSMTKVDFVWDGDEMEQEIQRDGSIAAIEIWRER